MKPDAIIEKMAIGEKFRKWKAQDLIDQSNKRKLEI